MFERIVVYFLTEPRRLEDLGRTLVLISAAIILAGLFGHVETIVTNPIVGLAGQSIKVKTLAEIHPLFPTWWIPETLVGGLPAILLAVAGLWLNATGKQIRQVMR